MSDELINTNTKAGNWMRTWERVWVSQNKYLDSRVKGVKL